MPKIIVSYPLRQTSWNPGKFLSFLSCISPVREFWITSELNVMNNVPFTFLKLRVWVHVLCFTCSWIWVTSRINVMKKVSIEAKSSILSWKKMMGLLRYLESVRSRHCTFVSRVLDLNLVELKWNKRGNGSYGFFLILSFLMKKIPSQFIHGPSMYF